MTKYATLLSVFWPEYLKYIRANLKPRTVEEYERLYDKLIQPKFGRRRLKSLTTAEIEKWHLDLRKEAPVQANRALAVLSSLLKLAARWGYIPINPATGIHYAKETQKKSYLSLRDRKAFLAAVEEEKLLEKAFLLALYYSGARPGELTGAKRSQWTGPTIELPDSKTGERTIYLPEPAQKAMEAGCTHTDGPLFPKVNPTIVWRRVCRRAKLKGFRPYDLRHTFASAGLEAGMSLEEISQLLGHADPKTTRRYTHLSKEAGTNGAAKAAGVLSQE